MLSVLLAILAASLGIASPLANVAFVNPTVGGGSWLDDAGTGVGEPMNVSQYAEYAIRIVSEHSSAGGHFGSQFPCRSYGQWNRQLCTLTQSVSHLNLLSIAMCSNKYA